jgi:hypothetical protein
MNKFETVVVITTFVVCSIASFFVGHFLGGIQRQQLIVNECKESNLYLDRRLALECRANEVSRKSV